MKKYRPSRSLIFLVFSSFFFFSSTRCSFVPLIRRSRALFNEPLNLFDTRNYAAPFTASESRRFDLDQTLSSLVAAFGNKKYARVFRRGPRNFFLRFRSNRWSVHSTPQWATKWISKTCTLWIIPDHIFIECFRRLLRHIFDIFSTDRIQSYMSAFDHFCTYYIKWKHWTLGKTLLKILSNENV